MAEENRARFLRDSVNTPTPCRADGVASAMPANDLPPGILGAPLNSDPHRHGRHSHENLTQKPGERPGSHYTAENRRRLYDRGVKYR
jgi:hypothetical protein